LGGNLRVLILLLFLILLRVFPDPNRVIAPSTSTLNHHAVTESVHNCSWDALVANGENHDHTNGVMVHVDLVGLSHTTGDQSENSHDDEAPGQVVEEHTGDPVRVDHVTQDSQRQDQNNARDHEQDFRPLLDFVRGQHKVHHGSLVEVGELQANEVSDLPCEGVEHETIPPRVTIVIVTSRSDVSVST